MESFGLRYTYETNEKKNISVMSENLGNKIKQLREAAGLQLTDLAEAAGIQVSQIALVENNEVSPSISTLIKIARRMGVRLGTLLDGTEVTSPIVSSPQKLRSTVNTSKAGDNAHLDFYSLAGQKNDRNMEPFFINVNYVEQEKDNYSSHEGEEFIYILEGQVEVFYGSEKYLLNPGETIYYDSIVPHLVRSASKDNYAKLLAVTYTPN